MNPTSDKDEAALDSLTRRADYEPAMSPSASRTFQISPPHAVLNRATQCLTIALATGFITLTVMWHSTIFLSGPTSYNLSEWNINYAGGFIRRGLGGEIGNFFADHYNVPRGTTYFIISTFLYLFFIAAFFIISWSKLSLYELSLAASPFMLFYLLHTVSGLGRKEVLLFALFAVTALIVLWSKARPTVLLPGASIIIALFIPIGLIHEGLLMYAPTLLAFVCLAIWSHRSLSAALWLGVFGSMVIGVTFIAVFSTINGDHAPFDLMCARLGSEAPPGCGSTPGESALTWVVMGREETAASMAIRFQQAGPPPFSFIGMLVLGASLLGLLAYPLRLAGSGFSGLLAPLNQPLTHLILFGLVSYAPLYFSALDQGRFFQIYFTLCVLYCVLGRVCGLLEEKPHSAILRHNWMLGVVLLLASPFIALPVLYPAPDVPFGVRVVLRVLDGL